MGAFYGSILIRTENSDAVQKELGEVAKIADGRFLVGPPIDGWISVFPNNGGQDDGPAAEIAKRLSFDTFHLLVHDDDIFAYYFYRHGRLLDQYNSCPDYFKKVSDQEKQECRGRPELFQDLLRQPESLSKLKKLLATDGEKFTFEEERMERFVELFGLSNTLSSYEYLQSGERNGIKGWKQFVHIPDLSAEKAAKRAVETAIKAEKRRLQKEGVFLAEICPPKTKQPALINWQIDPATNGLLLASASLNTTSIADNNQFTPELLVFKPPWINPPESAGLKTNWTAHEFCMSPSAVWLAAGDGYIRVWNWQRKELAFEVAHTRAGHWVGFSQDENFLYSLGQQFIVTSMATGKPVVTIGGVDGARKAAVHPSGKFAAVALQGSLVILDLEKGELIKNLFINRRMETLDVFAKDAKGIVKHRCLKLLLEKPEIRKKLAVDDELCAAILQDYCAIERLTAEAQQIIESLIENVWLQSVRSFETIEQPFDVRFSPDGNQLFVASNGMRVFDWNKLQAADKDAPAPELSVDAPIHDEDDLNARPLAYSIAFDLARNLLLSSCLAGVIQFLNIKTGQSGTLLKPPGDLSIWRLKITSDGKALCFQGGTRPTVKNLNKSIRCLQVWNYPALCEAAGLK